MGCKTLMREAIHLLCKSENDVRFPASDSLHGACFSLCLSIGKETVAESKGETTKKNDSFLCISMISLIMQSHVGLPAWSLLLPLPVSLPLSLSPNDNTFNKEEVKAELLRLLVGFKCNWFTLRKIVNFEERSCDSAEENLKKGISNCVKLLLESLTSFCEDDRQAQEIIKYQVSQAAETMTQQEQNLKRMHMTTKFLNSSTFLNTKPFSLQRVFVASLPRNIGNAGMVAGQSKHHPSLQGFMSSYSQADAEEEKCTLNTKGDLSEKRSNPSKWDVSLTSFPQMSLDAIPMQDRDSWMSLEHISQKFLRLRHKPSPV
ncbi:unnamed protein product [Nyctereutes procyonoides]|uniref:(raccoon dog) hypothetical protein n=1 Tax=Nyctereutes procyonoides TaxID=34880 RepID=A0A811ZPJ8_NYCPR|nr:unnamed protein product [Nyctereutes procyonoides]